MVDHGPCWVGGPRAACQLRYKTKPEVEFEGSDHMLGGAQEDPLWGEFPAGSLLDLNKVVALHPNPGRQSKEDSEWIIQKSCGASSEKQWKRMICTHHLPQRDHRVLLRPHLHHEVTNALSVVCLQDIWPICPFLNHR